MHCFNARCAFMYMCIGSGMEKIMQNKVIMKVLRSYSKQVIDASKSPEQRQAEADVLIHI